MHVFYLLNKTNILLAVLLNIIICFIVSSIVSIISNSYLYRESFSYNSDDHSIKTGEMKVTNEYLSNSSYDLQNNNIDNINNLHCKTITSNVNNNQTIQMSNINTNNIEATYVHTKLLSLPNTSVENISNITNEKSLDTIVSKSIKVNSLDIDEYKRSNKSIKVTKLDNESVDKLKIDYKEISLSDELKRYILETIYPIGYCIILVNYNEYDKNNEFSMNIDNKVKFYFINTSTDSSYDYPYLMNYRISSGANCSLMPITRIK